MIYGLLLIESVVSRSEEAYFGLSGARRSLALLLIFVTLLYMIKPPIHVRDLQLLREIFGGSCDTSSLADLRIPAGSFQISDAQELIDRGLAQYRTETGIAFQVREDWDLVPTEKGRTLLKEGE